MNFFKRINLIMQFKITSMSINLNIILLPTTVTVHDIVQY